VYAHRVLSVFAIFSSAAGPCVDHDLAISLIICSENRPRAPMGLPPGLPLSPGCQGLPTRLGSFMLFLL
jgi:hypothetical protein